ncbi:MAG: DUF839 domain-containing protein, partial [Actinobacteria bacterium]|nr:DUF839 domain-containing protein [Actinomycetota bacterium]
MFVVYLSLHKSSSKTTRAIMSNEMHEEVSNTSNNREFEDVLNSYMSRRSLLVGSLAGAALSFVGARAAAAASNSTPTAKAAVNAITAKSPKIGFTSIPLQGSPMPTIAPEYAYSVLAPWREKLDGSGTSFEYAGFTAEQQAQSIGIGHDGMWYFGDNKKGLLCINHEYGTNPHVMGKKLPTSAADVALSQTAHGISVVAIENVGGKWKIAKSNKNRRVHVNTLAKMSGPVATSTLIQNVAGNPIQGTMNNCANGKTPWGTYLTCEENFNGYFGATSTTWKASAEQARYGITATGNGYDWHKYDARFDVSNANYANEANRFGYVVEIDPN